MSRAGTTDTVIVKPTPNIYTVLVFASFLAAAGALVSLFLVGKTLFGDNWLFGK